MSIDILTQHGGAMKYSEDLRAGRGQRKAISERNSRNASRLKIESAMTFLKTQDVRSGIRMIPPRSGERSLPECISSGSKMGSPLPLKLNRRWWTVRIGSELSHNCKVLPPPTAGSPRRFLCLVTILLRYFNIRWSRRSTAI